MVVAGCDAPKLLQTVEKALDVVAISVAAEVTSDWLAAVRLGRDDRQDATPEQVFTHGVTVISLVREQGFGFGHWHIEQRRDGPVI